jgi:outer membrane protein OmpA-like peptidoglycan-associated protein/tetratricopeptide (TPR) repeat protein
MKNILLFFTVLAFISNIHGQNKANDYYEAGYFKEASIIFEKELDKGRGDTESLQFKLADSYFQMNEYSSSIKIYEDLYKNENKDSLTLIRLAELNRMFCKYDEAQKYYSVYKENHISNEEDKSRYENIIKSKVTYPKTNSDINNSVELNDLTLPQVKQGMGYTFLDNGDLLGGIEQENKETKTTFTTLGLFSSSTDFQQVEQFEFNEETPFFNAYPSYSKASKVLYFTANISKKKRSFKDGKNVLQVYSFSTESSENESKLLAFNKSQYNFTHPSISADGERLYFVSDIPGGYGGYDVYYVDKTEEGWSDIKNCGSKINTIFDELTPFITGDSLFFSSYGHENYGGSDIFLSIKDGNDYTEPTNLGLPVNSCMNDFSFIMTNEAGSGILTSDRNSSTTNKDDVFQVFFPLAPNSIVDELTNDPIAQVAVTINGEEELMSDDKGEWSKRISVGDRVTIEFDNPYYETKILEYADVSNADLEEIKNVTLAPIMISGQVIDDITGNPIDDVKVTLYEKVEEDEWKLVEVKMSDDDGKWAFHVRKDREYKVVQEKGDYISHNEIIPRYDDSKELRNEVLSRMNPFSMKYDARKDLVIQIDNIYFDFNSSIIQKESYPVLENLKKFLNENPNVKVELSAHTDCMGEDKYNLWLSKRRAKSSREYLINAGISPGRIESKGYGEQKMIVKDCELQKKDDSQAQKNRRVEVKIL